MANSSLACRAVLDSNVLIAAHRSTHLQSPNRELIERWQAREFTFLFSRDTLPVELLTALRAASAPDSTQS